MGKFGLSNKVTELILSVFLKHKNIRLVKVFGSRAMDNFKPSSDIDLALWGNIDNILLGKIIDELDDLSTPYLFDIVVYSDINNPKLQEHIDSVGKIIYQQDD